MQRSVDKHESATIVRAGERRFYRVYWSRRNVAQCSDPAACIAGHAAVLAWRWLDQLKKVKQNRCSKQLQTPSADLHDLLA
jgi:hypothetical protein